MGHGIGMPRGMPRTKRTAKPQRGVYDVLQRYRAGLVQPEFIGSDTVKLQDGHMTVMIPRSMFDRWSREEGHTGGIHINIRVNSKMELDHDG